MYLPEVEARVMRAILVKDSEFLRDHNIMDYSLLVGVRISTVALQSDAASSVSGGSTIGMPVVISPQLARALSTDNSGGDARSGEYCVLRSTL